MDFFVWILFTILGGAVGAGVTSMVIKERLAKEEEERRLALEKERLDSAEELAQMRHRLDEATSQGNCCRQDLEQKAKECVRLGEELKAIAGLEETIVQLRKKNSLLEEEKNDSIFKAQDLQQKIMDLEEELVQEKEAINDCLFFVRGSHYIPGSVVKDLMRQAHREGAE
ncbi:MAG: hypothetical protein C0613_13625 [Desulfobulbaceae bacterium]|nr:MAG: hypothetical protein C0613_13625 [Desulfobulbaceae bacterium]